ncbi:MAG: ABC transporter permease [Christensenellales bacterium]|jgi:putative aldouronate transport system permease protein
MARRSKAGTLLPRIRQYWQIYLLILPAIAVLLFFRYYPMYGLQIAFRDYKIVKGILGSKFVGWKWFIKLFNTPKFTQVVANTLLINLLHLTTNLPLSIVFGLLLNECAHIGYKRVIQTVSYMPHFLSWVIVYAVFNNMLSTNGIINALNRLLGGKTVVYLTQSRYFRGILVISALWKNTGWNTIVILAAITAIDMQLYEAAVMDGASRLRRVWHITLPGIRSTIVVLLILQVGAIMVDDVTQVLLFYNTAVYDVGDVLGTYIYRQGLGKMDYSLTSAAGLFQSVIGMILILITNRIAHMMGEQGLW